MKLSHAIRFTLFAFVIAAAALGATLTHTASPVSAFPPPPETRYVDDNYAGSNGAACVAYATNYNHCYATITAAINDSDAAAGDTIWVDDGTYNEQVFINKPLTIVSFHGPTLTKITQNNSSYVVHVEADPVTFGGPGTVIGGGGFTVTQSGTGAAFDVNGSDVDGPSLTIQNNVFEGTDSLYGVNVNPPIVGGHATISGNTFKKSATAVVYSFQIIVNFDSADQGAPAQLAAAQVVGRQVVHDRAGLVVRRHVDGVAIDEGWTAGIVTG
ncbi:MAG: hypothetical protein ABI559_01495, partial [Chloroflexota bacterium]